MGGKYLGSILFFLASFTTGTMAAGFVEEVKQPLEKIYFPIGYDTDDSVQIVVAGNFPNNCFQVGPIETTVSENNQSIELRMTAYRYDGKCDFAGSFHQVVYLGRIRNRGNYALVDGHTGKGLGSLPVDDAPATTVGTDAKTYAPLFDAYVKRTFSGPKVSLSGIFPANMRLDKVEMKLQGDVLLVLPYVKPRTVPAGQTEPYNFDEDFLIAKENLPKGKFLLHVRSMGGQAINKLIPN